MVEQLSNETRPLGMVPTMGALHLGHLSLIERAIEENQTVLISIFSILPNLMTKVTFTTIQLPLMKICEKLKKSVKDFSLRSQSR